MRRRWRTLGALALAVVLAGCNGGDAADAPTAEFSDGGAQAPTEETIPASGDDTATDEPVGEVVPTDRKVIRTGELAIRASDTRRAMERITALVEASGGYVASSTVHPIAEDEQPAISITIRVPAGELTSALAAIRELSDEVVSETIQSQDVTEEYTDVESRLRNLTALETELVALLAEVRRQPDAEPQELLQVFNEVGRVRGEIEVLEGRRRLLEDQTSLSTITIDITPPPIEEPIVEEGWQPLLTVRRALGDLVETLQTFADGALWLLIYALPVLTILALPLYLLVRIANRRSRRRTPAPPPPPPPAPAPAHTASGTPDETN